MVHFCCFLLLDLASTGRATSSLNVARVVKKRGRVENYQSRRRRIIASFPAKLVAAHPEAQEAVHAAHGKGQVQK